MWLLSSKTFTKQHHIMVENAKARQDGKTLGKFARGHGKVGKDDTNLDTEIKHDCRHEIKHNFKHSF